MRWLEEKIIAPLDRQIAKVERWYEESDRNQKALALFCGIIVLAVVLQLAKLIV